MNFLFKKSFLTHIFFYYKFIIQNLNSRMTIGKAIGEYQHAD